MKMLLRDNVLRTLQFVAWGNALCRASGDDALCSMSHDTIGHFHGKEQRQER